MDFMLSTYLSFFIIFEVLACLDIETISGYENDAVELVFNVEVPSTLTGYQVTRTNVENATNLLVAVYHSDGSLSTLIQDGGVEFTGNVSAGNLSIRILSMNISSVGAYILKRTSKPQENITCYELLLRARPNIPVISSSDPSGNSVTGIEDKDVTLVCRSTGGYPKTAIAWYRTSNQTTQLATNNDQPQRDDRTYQLEYTFRALRADDGATFICQSSYDPPSPLYMQAKIKLNLSLKPSTPILSLETPLRESSNNMVIANCSSSGYKPDTARLTLMLEGSTLVPVSTSYPSSNGTFMVTSEYTSAITKTLNGKLLTCSVNHTALDTPLRAQRNLDVQFAPRTASLSGVSSGIVADVNNKITLTCTAGSSNPPSNITWYRNYIKIQSYSQIQHTSGLYNGNVTSQKLVFEAVRDMDGDQIVCEVNNVVNGDNRLKSDTRTLDLRFHPIAELSDGAPVVEGKEKIFHCNVQSKPASSITWYHEEANLLTGPNTNYKIPVVNRSHAGIYRCEAYNGYLPNGTSQKNLIVLFAPRTASLSGVSSGIVADVNNKITLTCTAGSSNPPSNITWYRNYIKIQSNSQIQHTSGLYNGNVTSQKLVFEAVRDMDGDQIVCEVNNVVNGDNPLKSDTRTLDLRYHPIAGLSDGAPVVEGKEKIFHCNVQSKPASSITWYHEEANLLTGPNTNYKIPVVNRSHAGTYRCEAYNGYLPNGTSQTNLIVLYTPDVEVTTTNVTVNASSTQLRCLPSGIPAVYTFSEWQHVWPGVGPVIHKTGLGTNQTLTLTQLTYEYSGIYNCSVSNGIQGSLNPNAGYGLTYLQIETYPIITADGDFKVPGRLDQKSTATIEFYSNVKDNNVACYIGNITHACSAVFMDGEVNLPLFDTTIQTSGTFAHISFNISSVDQFGVLNIKISNSIGYSERAIEVIPEGPPQIPTEVSIVQTQSNSVTLSWVPGFHGGFNQTFVIEYSTDGQTWLPENTVEIQGGLTLRRINGTVSNLQSGTMYYMGLMSRNEKGSSNYTRVFNVTTELSQVKPSTPMLSLETPLRESSNNMVIANCSSSGYKPDTARLTLMLEGSTLVPVSTSYPSSNGTFMVTSEYTSAITKTLNGKLLTCSVNHTALDTPLRAQRNLDVQFAPRTASLSGVSSGIVADVNNKITLTCTAGSSNPPSNITWYRNYIKIQSYSQIQHTSGLYNGNVTSQKLVFEAVRDMDGDQIVCEVNNVVNGDNRLKSDTRTLDLRFHPIAELSDGAPVVEGKEKIFHCNVQSKPASSITWYHKEANLLTGPNTNYKIPVVNRSHAGIYRCEAYNGYLPNGTSQKNLIVLFAPRTASLSGVSSGIVADVNNKITITCTAGSSNPPSNITWYRNYIKIQSNSQIQHTSGLYNGNVTSQKLVFEAVRDMDGDQIVCEVNNVVNGDNPLKSDTRTLDLRYHPIAGLSDGAPVVEGKEKIFHCNVQSKPASSITWYHEEANLLTGPNTNYKIPVVNRSHAGTYRCEAYNGYLPNGTSQTNLIVLYTPDVEVTTTNVTVNASSTQLRCLPSGIPAVYTFSEWQHVWPGVGPVIHKTGLGTNQTLTLTQLTYEYSGIYNCSVSNGIQGSLNPNAGYGLTYLQIETYPIITADGDFKVPGRLDQKSTATIEFYSNVKDNNVACYIGNITHACSAVFMDGEVNLPLFDTTIQTSGTFAHISFNISSVDQFGVLNIKISNSIGYSERAIEVIPEGPPQIPTEVSIVQTQSNSVTLSWVPGFHGGFNQTFVIEYSTDGQTWLPENTVEIQGGLTLRRINGTVSNLQSGTMYYMRLMSRNEKGSSNYTRVFNVTTELSQGSHPAASVNKTYENLPLSPLK